jgi:lysophospholipid acyltransferase (LPLAT)-like uncharacterized protein
MNIIENPMKSNRKLILTIIFSVCVIALFGVIQTAEAQETTNVSGPVVNPIWHPHFMLSHILTLHRATLHHTVLLAMFSLWT